MLLLAAEMSKKMRVDTLQAGQLLSYAQKRKVDYLAIQSFRGGNELNKALAKLGYKLILKVRDVCYWQVE